MYGKAIEGTKYKKVIKLTLRNKKRRSSAKNDRGLVNSDHNAAFYDVKHLQKVKANYKSEFLIGNYSRLLSRCSLECQSCFRFNTLSYVNNWQKISRQFLANQKEEIKSITTWSQAFSRAFGGLHLISSTFEWFFWLSVFAPG